MRAYLQINGSQAKEVWGTVVAELPLTVYLNDQRFVTLLCSPFQVEPLVVGHLWMERSPWPKSSTSRCVAMYGPTV